MTEEKVTHRFYVAGVKFHELHTVINDISEGETLLIDPEPTNKYDPNAIRLIYDNFSKRAMIGYVPKRFSSEVSALIELEHNLQCVVSKLTPGAKPWEQIEVEIREIDEQ